MDNSPLYTLLSSFKDLRRIVITSHVNSDGDSLGSLLGLYWLIKDNFSHRKVSLVINDDSCDRFAFLPGINLINQEEDFADDFLLICVDAADLSRLGQRPGKLVGIADEVVNIDHHVSNTKFGKLNFVEIRSSTAELLGSIFSDWFSSGLISTISADCRLCLLTGIVSDTGSFRYPLTKPETLRLAAFLSEGPGDSEEVPLAKVAQSLFSSRKLSELRLKGDAIGRIEFFNERVAFVSVSSEEFAKHHANYDDCDGLVESIRDIEGVEIAVVARFDGEKWRVSLRGTNEEDDLSLLAGRFGGGGHRMAAAFSWNGELNSLRDKLRKVLSG